MLYDGRHIRQVIGQDNQRGDEQRRGRHHAARQVVGRRNQLAGVVDGGQRCAQLRRGLEPRGGVDLEAARDQCFERLRNRRVEGSQRRQPLLAPLSHRVNAIDRPCTGGAARPRQHLVEDETERVDVGARVDRAAGACSGAMYSSVPMMLPDAASELDTEMPKSMICA